MVFRLARIVGLLIVALFTSMVFAQDLPLPPTNFTGLQLTTDDFLVNIPTDWRVDSLVKGPTIIGAYSYKQTSVIVQVFNPSEVRTSLVKQKKDDVYQYYRITESDTHVINGREMGIRKFGNKSLFAVYPLATSTLVISVTGTFDNGLFCVGSDIARILSSVRSPKTDLKHEIDPTILSVLMRDESPHAKSLFGVSTIEEGDIGSTKDVLPSFTQMCLPVGYAESPGETGYADISTVAKDYTGYHLPNVAKALTTAQFKGVMRRTSVSTSCDGGQTFFKAQVAAFYGNPNVISIANAMVEKIQLDDTSAEISEILAGAQGSERIFVVLRQIKNACQDKTATQLLFIYPHGERLIVSMVLIAGPITLDTMQSWIFDKVSEWTVFE